ncbi:hypothetical protein DMC01_00970 [Campylobacter troglodytis]|nr:hypothetical protein DMC01_00970 [Campylobacter troglodytis]
MRENFVNLKKLHKFGDKSCEFFNNFRLFLKTIVILPHKLVILSFRKKAKNLFCKTVCFVHKEKFRYLFIKEIKIKQGYEFKVKNRTFWLKNSKNLRELFVAFLTVNLFKFLLNFCEKIQGFCEFKMRNSQNSRLFCFEFFKQFKQGYEFKRKIHAFTRIKNV